MTTHSLNILALWLLLNLTLSCVIEASSSPISRKHSELHSNYHVWAVELKDPSTKRHLTNEEAETLAQQRGFHHLGQVGELSGTHLFAVPDENSEAIETLSIRKRSVRSVEAELMESPTVYWYAKQVPRKRHKRDGIVDPDRGKDEEENVEVGKDPKSRNRATFFRRSGTTRVRSVTESEEEDMPFVDPLYKFQWHLKNRLTVGGLDINALPVWKQGVNGSGVTVSVIDDGVDFTHPDLADAFSLSTSWDFNEHSREPVPGENDHHGTRCAGQIAARPNTVCGVGVAYGAKISGERLISESPTDADEANAFNWHMQENHIYSSSWGPSDDGISMEGPTELAERALIEGTSRGRNGLGSIFLFASGNGGQLGDNCNFDGYANNPYTIAIGAINSRGVMAHYSEICSAVLAVTLSSGLGQYITTTDIQGTCARDHSGTSAAAPLAAGMIALMISVMPELGWRDVQHLIVDKAVQNDRKDLSWELNGSGRLVSHKYGFGMMDAAALVNGAREHVFVPEPVLVSSLAQVYVNQKIPLNEMELVSNVTVKQEDVPALTFVESVQVAVWIQHPYRGHLYLELISPKGTRSVLATVRSADNSTQGYNGWRFTTVRNWGESPVGVWKLYVSDSADGVDPTTGQQRSQGTLQAWTLTVYGTCTGKDVRTLKSGRRTCSSESAQGKWRETLKHPAVVGLLVLFFGIIGGVCAHAAAKCLRNRWRQNRGPDGGFSVGLMDLGKKLNYKGFQRVAKSDTSLTSQLTASLEDGLNQPFTVDQNSQLNTVALQSKRPLGLSSSSDGHRSADNLLMVRTRSLADMSNVASKEVSPIRTSALQQSFPEPPRPINPVYANVGGGGLRKSNSLADVKTAPQVSGKRRDWQPSFAQWENEQSKSAAGETSNDTAKKMPSPVQQDQLQKAIFGMKRSKSANLLSRV